MKFLKATFYLSFIFLLSACDGKRELVVYADPNLAPLAKAMLEDFSSSRDVQVELKIISTELIGRHLLHGQPVDLVLACDPDLFEEQYPVFNRQMALPLGSDRIVLVDCIDQDQAKALKSDSCYVVAASDTPLRRATEAWLIELNRNHDCLLYADFQGILRAYLSRGWVKGGYDLQSAVIKDKNAEVIGKGPVLKNWHFYFLPKTGKNKVLAADFGVYLDDPIRKKRFADFGLIP